MMKLKDMRMGVFKGMTVLDKKDGFLGPSQQFSGTFELSFGPKMSQIGITMNHV